MCSKSSSMAQVLQRIISQTENHLSSNSRKPFHVGLPSHPPQQPSIDIKIPDPPPIIPKLSSLGVSPDLLKKLDDLYQEKARALRERCEANVRSTCSQLSCIPVPGISPSSSEEKILRAVTELYLRRMKDWMDAILQLLVPISSNCTAAKSLQSHGNNSKTPFNHKYTPLLEHFFDENPFPSHADKTFLARKSGMSYRQIHVWNRRNRSKKEGRVLRRKPMSEGAILPLDNLYQRMKNFIATPCIEESLTRGDNVAATRNVKKAERHVLDPVPPPRAFPTKYAGPCAYDAFPVNNDQVKIPTPNWYRQPATTLLKRTQQSVDMDDLVNQFSQLSVRNDGCSRGRKPVLHQNDLLTAITPTTVMPPPAPHPALIPYAPPLLVPSQLPLPSKRMTCDAHAFGMWSDTPVTLVPVVSCPTPDLSQRKIAPLPRRISRGSLVCRRSSFSSSSSSTSSPSLSSLPPSTFESSSPEQSPRPRPASLLPSILTAQHLPLIMPTGIQSDLGSYILSETTPYFQHCTPPMQMVANS